MFYYPFTSAGLSPALCAFALRLEPQSARFIDCAALDPNWIALFGRSAASVSPSARAHLRRQSFSPTPLSALRSHTSCRGIASAAATTASSRKGCLTSTPRSAMTRSSRPRLRRCRRETSATRADRNSPQFSVASVSKAVRCRTYPPQSSSAPTPHRSARARERTRPRGAPAASNAAPSSDAASHRAPAMPQSIAVAGPAAPLMRARRRRRCAESRTSVSGSASTSMRRSSAASAPASAR
mmetsp:Transcript_5137/g.17923  ORF Transcript_5137/g.17923 Transcript_5137/m.17923 type:complete len:240 (+) Transcript_5137:1135-1854(+)